MTFTEGDLRWIKKHTEKQLKEYNMGKRLVDVLGKEQETRSKVLSKLKKLAIVIGPSIDAESLHTDWEFVNTLIDSIKIDGGIPTQLELEQCNKLWRKYNVK